MMRSDAANADPRRRCRLLDQGRGKLLPDPARRLFLRGGASLGALALLTGCDIVDGRRPPSARCARCPISTTGCRRGCSTRTGWRRPIRKARSRGRFPSMPITPRTRRPRSTRTDYRLVVDGLVDEQEALDPGRALRAAAGDADHAPRSASRAGARSASGPARRCANSCAASAPTRARNMSVPLRGGLFHLHRHADRAASADADDVQVRRRDAAAQIRLPDAHPHADQARLQEPQARDGIAVINKYPGGYWEDQGYNWFSGN